MNATIHVASILAVALTLIPASAQTFAWSQRTPASSPSPRSSHAMAYDAARQRVVLFGGSSGGSVYLGDTLEWDGTNWTQLAPASSPSSRADHAMAYDSARQRVVLFGGSGSSGNLGDTWEWDGTNWLARFSLNYPSPRTDHAMAYDAARQRVVLCGGSSGGNETWVWDGTNWTQLTPASSPSPIGHAMAYDAARQRVVLFGCCSQTWEWDGTNWTLATPSVSPSARTDHALAYDEVRQRTVLFGGGYGSAFYDILLYQGTFFPSIYFTYTVPIPFGDTWEWDGTNWTQLAPASSPSSRADHAMAYDSARQRVVLFGGYYNNHYTVMTSPGATQIPGLPPAYPLATYVAYIVPVALGDTWVNSNSLPVTLASATAYGAGCGSPALGFVPDTNGRPVLGQVGSITIVNAPTSIAAVAVGWNNQSFGPFALPVPLAGIGMPGCDLLQSADILGVSTSPLTPSTLSFSLAIPNVPSLLGSHVYLQAYAFAPGVNPLQIIISNGIDWLIGYV